MAQAQQPPTQAGQYILSLSPTEHSPDGAAGSPWSPLSLLASKCPDPEPAATKRVCREAAVDAPQQQRRQEQTEASNTIFSETEVTPRGLLSSFSKSHDA